MSIYYTLTPIGDDASQFGGRKWRLVALCMTRMIDQEVLAVDEREIVSNFLHDSFEYAKPERLKGPPSK